LRKFTRLSWISLILLILLAMQALAAPAQGQGPTPTPTPAAVTDYPVLFERAGAKDQPVDLSNTVQIINVGDTIMARGVEARAKIAGIDFPLSRVANRLREADIAVGNYESVLAAEGVGRDRGGPLRMRSNPDGAGAVARAGFKLMNVANNHTFDYGPDGLASTVKALNDAGVKTVGAGPTRDAAETPLVMDVKGVKIVWLAFTMVIDPPDGDEKPEGWSRAHIHAPPAGVQKIRAAAAAARPLGDALIVEMHWGQEYQNCPDEWQVAVGRAAIEAGASAVIGHHPHVIQSYEVYKGGFIAYSLGNFLFDQDRLAMAVWLRVDKNGLRDVRGMTLHSGVSSIWVNPVSSAANLTNLCRDGIPPTPRTSGVQGLDRGVALFGVKAGQFGPVDPGPEPVLKIDRCLTRQQPRDIGTLDMEGDGGAETVRIEDGTLTIRREGALVYSSYPSWQVIDAALGDPNQDGREEVLMLLWKQDDPAGPITTHPFIVGYRNGQYKVIWGGSTPDNWLQAVAIGDLDGDRLDELVTIERDPAALACDPRYRVVVLAWNGWGFTKRWASDYGSYNRLRFVRRPDLDGGIAIVAETF